jgi:SAM-dependent methyltransferase
MLSAWVDEAEQVFQAPPFTEKVAETVQLISTRLAFKADEASRLLCQKESNAASHGEYSVLAPLFEQMGKPRRILDIGAGFGRAAIYFSKKGLWGPEAEIHLYDANGERTKYKRKYYASPPRWPDVSSFCGNLEFLRQVLEYNGIRNYRIFDAAELPLSRLPGPYDLIYSFFSVGFHWSLEFYLGELEPLLHEKTVLVCTLNKQFRPFPRLSEFSTRVLEYPEIKKNSPPLRLLVLSKSDLPAAGLSVQEASAPRRGRASLSHWF